MKENSERWMELAEQPAREQDPEKLIELVRQIDELLEKKHHCRDNSPTSQPESEAPKDQERATG